MKISFLKSQRKFPFWKVNENFLLEKSKKIFFLQSQWKFSSWKVNENFHKKNFEKKIFFSYSRSNFLFFFSQNEKLSHPSRENHRENGRKPKLKESPHLIQWKNSDYYPSRECTAEGRDLKKSLNKEGYNKGWDEIFKLWVFSQALN